MDRFLPDRRTITGFGNGGFRFGDHSHLGSLLVTPSGMRAWPVQALTDVSINTLDMVTQEHLDIDFLVVGAGDETLALPHVVRAHLLSVGLTVEVMTTSAAVHVYNVTFAEGRRVAAALIAVGHAV